jgi:hypothetical protein
VVLSEVYNGHTSRKWISSSTVKYDVEDQDGDEMDVSDIEHEC